MSVFYECQENWLIHYNFDPFTCIYLFNMSDLTCDIFSLSNEFFFPKITVWQNINRFLQASHGQHDRSFSMHFQLCDLICVKFFLTFLWSSVWRNRRFLWSWRNRYPMDTQRWQLNWFSRLCDQVYAFCTTIFRNFNIFIHVIINVQAIGNH